jgi:hypothetical protein
MAVSRINELLEGADGEVIRLYVQSESDRRISLALKSWSEKHPTSEDLPKRLEDIEGRITAKDAELAAERLKHFAFRKATEAGIDPDLLDGFNATDEAAITKKIDALSKLAHNQDLRTRNELLGLGHKPGSGNPEPADNRPAWEQRMTPEEQMVLAAERARQGRA